MAVRTLRLRADRAELYSIFQNIFREHKFTIIHEEHLGSGFRIVAVNKKKESQMIATLMSLMGGFLARNRLGVEIFAVEKEGCLDLEMRSAPYIPNIDMEAVVESRSDLDRCGIVIDFFEEKIFENFKREIYNS
jgi:hypothetical protein